MNTSNYSIAPPWANRTDDQLQTPDHYVPTPQTAASMPDFAAAEVSNEPSGNRVYHPDMALWYDPSDGKYYPDAVDSALADEPNTYSGNSQGGSQRVWDPELGLWFDSTDSQLYPTQF